MEVMDRLNELAKEVLEESKRQGAEHATVFFNEVENIGTRFGEKHITQNVYRTTQNFTLKTQIGEKIGIYHGSRPDTSKISSMVADALTLTKFSAADKNFPGFLEEQPAYRESNAVVNEMDPEEIADAVKAVVDRGVNFSDKISAVAGNIHYIKTANFNLNTYGVTASSLRSTVSAVVNMAATNYNGEARSTARVAGVNLEDLQLDKKSDSVAKRAVDGLNQGEMEIGKYETVLGPGAVAGLWTFIIFGSSSLGLINHSSFLKDKIGEEIFDKRLSVTDDTSDMSLYSAKTYDTEMVPSNPVNYVDKGVFKEYAYNRRTAKLLGVESNGRNASGFQGEMPMFLSSSIQKGDKSEEELIASVDKGIFVTNLFYNNYVNAPQGICTGLTRDGLFRIENGEIVGSLKNFRWTDSLISIFKDAEPGNNLLQTGGMFGGGIKIPSVKVDSFNLSSKGKH